MRQLVTPKAHHLRWLDLEIGMFIHFGINTYYNKQWSNGTKSPDKFDPSDLDCDQWVSVARDMGANYIVLTAKHHDGFCLWRTKTTDYSVASSPYKGDVVGEFIAACRRANMPFGLYLSPWDRNCPFYEDMDKYAQFYLEQLRELLVEYCKHDELVELWLDGANSYKDAFNWDPVDELVRKHHPNCNVFNMGYPDIRWVGNELGNGQYPNYHVIKFKEWPLYELGKGASDGYGDHWTNLELDFPIRTFQWFYQTRPIKMPLFSVKSLFKKYLNSVGQGANMLLNIGPEKSGRIPEKDALRAKEFGDLIRKRFSDENLIASTSGTGNTLELEFERQKIDTIILQEDLNGGQRVDSYQLFYWDEEWKLLKTRRKTLTIGHKKIDELRGKIATNKIRLVIKQAIAEPIIQDFSVYLIR